MWRINLLFMFLFSIAFTAAKAETLHFEGNLAPLPLFSVIVPFDGVISTVPPKEGEEIASGSRIVSFESSKLEQSISETEASLQALESLLHQKSQWKNSSEMRLARQQLHQAKQSKDRFCERLHYSEGLFKEGIISREELTLDMQQCESQTMYFDWAQSHYNDIEKQSVLPPGTKDQIKQLRQYLKVLEEKKRQKVFKAKETGVFFRRDIDKPLYLGMVVQEGQILGDFISSKEFQVQFYVDEWDIVRMEEGAVVLVQFYAFPGVAPKKAKISNIAKNMTKDRGSITNYVVTANMPIPSELSSKWRFGMRASISAEVFDDAPSNHPM